ncbi:hypothetical protein [Thalassobacillus hwangdonensis]
MEIYVASFFSALIIYITVHSMIKVLTIALKRNEITKRKFRLYVAMSIGIGLAVAAVLPLGYRALFGWML